MNSDQEPGLKNQYPIPYASNGTVVAIGKRSMVGNKEFVMWLMN